MEIKRPETEAKDYVKDGILYCGRCKTPKQTKVPFMEERAVNCMCECESERYRKQKAVDAEKKRIAKIENLRSRGIPDKALREYRFEYDSGENPKLTEVAKDYVRDFSRMKDSGAGIHFYGGVGSGKTFTALCIANALIDKGIPCFTTTFGRIVDELKGKPYEWEPYIDTFNDFDLLVIDDFNTWGKSEEEIETMLRVIWTRTNRGLPLILTSTLDKTDMPAIALQCVPVYTGAKDRRKHRIDSGLVNKIYGHRGQGK